MSPSNRNSSHSRQPHLRLIAMLGVVVPRRLRADWRQEWQAELRCRELLLADWDKLNWKTKLDLLRRSLGAFWDALVLQPQRLEDEMFQDLRYGARMLLKRPGFSLLAVFTLALGIGASTAIFSAVNPILFESLPYPQAGRMVMIWEARKDGGQIASTFGAYRAFVERAPSFEALAVMKSWQPTIIGDAQPERLDGQRVSASYFGALGVSPSFGRDFLESDDQLNGPKVAIISDALWRRRFGGDNGIVGRQVRIDDAGYTIIGVMPNTFENVLTPSADVWSPLQYDPSLPPQSREWGHHLRMVGRLRAGASANKASLELDQVLNQLLTIASCL